MQAETAENLRRLGSLLQVIQSALFLFCTVELYVVLHEVSERRRDLHESLNKTSVVDAQSDKLPLGLFARRRCKFGHGACLLRVRTNTFVSYNVAEKLKLAVSKPVF